MSPSTATHRAATRLRRQQVALNDYLAGQWGTTFALKARRCRAIAAPCTGSGSLVAHASSAEADTAFWFARQARVPAEYPEPPRTGGIATQQGATSATIHE
jgi:hypothetical protein